MDFEQDIIPVIKDHAEYFRPVKPGVYQTKCWACGDSNDPKHRHMYLFPEGERCGYYCHKCGVKGSINQQILDQLIGPNSFHLSSSTIRRISPSNPNVQVETDIPDRRSSEYQYLRWRLGKDFTPDELYKFRIISNQQKFISDYNIKNINPIRNTILFLSADSNILNFRNLTENDDYRWIKKKVYERYESCPYTIRGSFDIMDDQPKVICMAEGIFDILGVYAHLTQSADLYAAALGKQYSHVFNWLLGKGIFGKNIDVIIYSDDDVPAKTIRQDVKPYKWLYGHIGIQYNDANHDYGVPSNKIVLRDPIYV